MSEDDFQVRPGRIRSRGVGGPRTFVGVALAAAARAGGLAARGAGSGGARSTGVFGRGRVAAFRASGRTRASRGAVVKARVVRTGGRGAPLALHLKYLQREGVTKDGAPGRMFDAASDEADPRAFAERCGEDRHHFRFIVSPDDAEQLADLKAFTRELMRQAEHDLGTGLDWVAAEHWNTGHPHLHVLVRGRADDGRDLVISRDYIREGLRGRAGALVSLELGPRTEAELQRDLQRQVEAERWTGLDRALMRQAGDRGVVDLRPIRGRPPGLHELAQVARVRRLQSLGLAEAVAPGRWRLADDAEATLRELGQRGDIIARMHRALGPEREFRDPAQFSLDEAPEGLVGRLAGRGLADELRGSGYAVIEGLDGRTHHLALADLEDASDAAPGAVVRVRQQVWGNGRSRTVLEVRSDLSLAEQIRADGATWLDRQLVGRAPDAMGRGGWTEEVRAALEARTDTLVERGLAERGPGGVMFARGLLQTLRDAEVRQAAARLAQETGLEPRELEPEGTLRGTYRHRIDLASGRFAMIDDGLGFSLAPWRPELERHLGREVEGQLTPRGGVLWTLGRQRGLGL